ncbi:hypothetical protein [Photobacterium leiognathi]|uniref:Uncharacterized protein n=1 Tax=Photobacterium leiognathi TaxID=553611 RepID=A0A2T3MF08_PHOLE|nr:hypothetical protein [Photobacterium leiognathi]KJF95236.1 hypothetical protein UB34_18345 [Photobacterium leiognathi]PSV92381.1 hypothetical protein CTM89_05465 [Photobacterium leiognathi]
MTQLSLEAIHQQLNERNFIAEKVRIVTVEAMDPEVLATCTTTEDETFYNSYMNVIYCKGERYVLGYRCNEETIVDQAIIFKDGKYYDPTLQANSESFEPYQYAVLAEFKVFDMMKHAKTNKDFPPDVDYLFTKKKHFKNVIKA